MGKRVRGTGRRKRKEEKEGARKERERGKKDETVWGRVEP